MYKFLTNGILMEHWDISKDRREQCRDTTA